MMEAIAYNVHKFEKDYYHKKTRAKENDLLSTRGNGLLPTIILSRSSYQTATNNTLLTIHNHFHLFELDVISSDN